MLLHRSKSPRTVPLVRWRWGLNVLHPSRQYRRGDGGGNPVQITNYYTAQFVFVFLGSIICRLYKLTLSDQARVTLQLRVILSDLV